MSLIILDISARSCLELCIRLEKRPQQLVSQRPLSKMKKLANSQSRPELSC